MSDCDLAIDVLLCGDGGWMPAPYRITGPAFDRESICVGCQGCSGGWDGGLWYAPAAPHPGGGQAPALHFIARQCRLSLHWIPANTGVATTRLRLRETHLP